LHTENWLCNLPGSALKVPGGGWVVGGLEGKLSDQLWLSFSLALAKPINNTSKQCTEGKRPMQNIVISKQLQSVILLNTHEHYMK
jgi:hypothetical protein